MKRWPSFGMELVEIQSNSAADYLPNLQNAARSNAFDLIIGVGFLLADAMAEVTDQFPNQKFAIIDVTWLGKPNLQEVGFEEHKGSALVGALGAMVAAHYGYDKIGVVLGIEIPVLYKFEAGYRFGLHWGNAKTAEVTGKAADVGLLWDLHGYFQRHCQRQDGNAGYVGTGGGAYLQRRRTPRHRRFRSHYRTPRGKRQNGRSAVHDWC